MHPFFNLTDKINKHIRKINPLVFSGIFVVISLYYGQQKILIKPPQGMHRWRQADCASFALNYYQDGMRFFHPELHNLSSDHNTNRVWC